ncbi:YceD family protein [soil metagenome]
MTPRPLVPVADGEPPRLLVSVTEIRRHLGSRLAVHSELEASGLALALTDVRVVEGASLVFDGELESVSDGVVLTGVISVPWVGSCRRCLDDVSGTATVDVREVYEIRPVDGETWPLVNDQIDVGPLLHDSALLALPLAPLCREDCEGPAPDLFPTSVEADVEAGGTDDDVEEEPVGDPRWAALRDLEL